MQESQALLEKLLQFSVFAKLANNVDGMDISMLRGKLEAANLDLERTRAILVQRLKDHIASVSGK